MLCVCGENDLPISAMGNVWGEKDICQNDFFLVSFVQFFFAHGYTIHFIVCFFSFDHFLLFTCIWRTEALSQAIVWFFMQILKFANFSPQTMIGTYYYKKTRVYCKAIRDMHPAWNLSCFLIWVICIAIAILLLLLFKKSRQWSIFWKH